MNNISVPFECALCSRPIAGSSFPPFWLSSALHTKAKNRVYGGFVPAWSPIRYVRHAARTTLRLLAHDNGGRGDITSV